MNTTPTDVKWKSGWRTVCPSLMKIADIWGFGYDGQVEFFRRRHLAYTESSIYSENYVTVLFSLDKGILCPPHAEPGSFEDEKETAFSGSDYNDTVKKYPHLKRLSRCFCPSDFPLG
jgi:hypothetical protein